MCAALPLLNGEAHFGFESKLSGIQWSNLYSCAMTNHSLGSTKVPVIGRKDLDLHRLFVEVTLRGGIELVARDRRLKEVGRALEFPTTATNVSFILRKYYNMLLHHFEQVYFLGADIENPTIAGPTEDAPSPVPEQGMSEPDVAPDVEAASSHKTSKNPEASSSSLKGAPVAGVIDDEFDDGYLVTITVGNEKLRGAIFRTQGQPTGTVPISSGNDSQEPHQQHQKRSKVRKPNPPPAEPFKSGYKLFYKEQHAKLKPLYRGKSEEMNKAINDLWNNLSDAEKAVYQENGFIFEEKYRQEMKEHREKLKSRMSDILSEVVPSSGELALSNPAQEVEKDDSHQGLDANTGAI